MSPPNTMDAEMTAMKSTLMRMMTEWIRKELDIGIHVSEFEALEMHALLEKTIRVYQEEIRRK